MDTLLDKGDHGLGGQGFPAAVTGNEEKIQQALIRLTVPRGNFPLDRELGSLLYTLGQAAPGEWSGLAYQYVRQALSGMEGLAVEQVDCRRTGEGELAVTVELALGERAFRLTVPFAG